ncbi:MAG: DNA repair protein RecO [Patescibacteria group bacterium]
MHHIYHTEGIILDSKDFGEAGRYYFVFTREFGMLMASAQGVRKMSSKLRFVLQDFAYVKIDLVKGRDLWRITSASKTNQLESIKEKHILEVFSKIAKLLRRLLVGEDANQILFDDVLRGFLVLEKTKSKEEAYNTEAVIVLRILHNLGYIGGDEATKDLICSPFEKDLIFMASNNRTRILNQINKALKETHL